MHCYPYKFTPIYIEKIWGGRSLQRLFGRDLPDDTRIGESWELADLEEGVSRVANGPEAGTSLTDLTAELGGQLLGPAKPMENGRFPLLLKLLDANDILSLQVHPDAKAVREIGPAAALKTECWYYVESRDGYIYRGVKPNVSPEQFREAIENDTVEQLTIKENVATGDFHFLPAGTVHAIGPGLVVAEVQTPSDTTYRVTDWGRGREIHIERSMQCIHFNPPEPNVPGQSGDTLLVTDYFTVAKRTIEPDTPWPAPNGRCTALMFLRAGGRTEIRHRGQTAPRVEVSAGDTVLLPAALQEPVVVSQQGADVLEITLPEGA
ncbi:MAG: type I phosphomannose isomerase catalytic subunit [Phycisphaerae bacterium]